MDLLVHSAGPFQRRTECNVLEACIAAGVPYMDVCDDADYAQRAKRLHQKCAGSQHCTTMTEGWMAVQTISSNQHTAAHDLLKPLLMIAECVRDCAAFGMQGQGCRRASYHIHRHLPRDQQPHGRAHDL